MAKIWGKPDKLEPELAAPYQAWKTAPGPDTMAAMLDALKPDMERIARSQLGHADPAALSHARLLTAKSLGGYDPAKGRLGTHVFNQLQGLQRMQTKMTRGIRVPDAVAAERATIQRRSGELESELGRRPSDAELMDALGMPRPRFERAMQYRPATASGAFIDSETGDAFDVPSRTLGKARGLWLDLVADDLDPYHRQVLDMSLGRNGPEKSTAEIAKILNRSPGAISQARARIQTLLDKEPELSPFRR